ncbi:MAG: TIGR01906 family membrane protein [Acetivibrio sp.]
MSFHYSHFRKSFFSLKVFLFVFALCDILSYNGKISKFTALYFDSSGAQNAQIGAFMKCHLFAFLCSLLFFCVFLSLGLSIVLFFRPFYYMEIEHLNIVESSGFEEMEIIRNYDSLIDYYSPFYHGDFSLSSFPSSKEGRVHFEEVKTVFRTFFIFSGFSVLLLFYLISKKRKAKDWYFLHSSALYTAILPLLLIACFFIDFNRVFLLFHTLLFRNDYWLFSPETDPIIHILPEAFFMDAAIFIVFTIWIGSLSLEIAWRILHKEARFQK